MKNDDLIQESKEYINQAYQHFLSGNNMEAEECYVQAIELDPENEQIYLMRAELYKETGKELEALDDCTKAIALNPDNIRAYLMRAEIRLNFPDTYLEGLPDNYYEALYDCNMALKIEPNNIQAYWIRVRINSMSSPEEAIADLSKIIEIAPYDAKAYIKRSEIYSCSGMKEKAIADYNKALEIKSNQASIAGRAEMHKNLGMNKEFETDLNKAIELEPTNGLYYCERGFSHKDTKPEDALEDLNKAIKLMPKNGKAYTGLLMLYERLGMQKEVLGLCNKALENFPDWDLFLGRRAENYAVLNLLDKAMADCNQWIKVDSTNERAYELRSQLHKKLGNAKAAELDTKRAQRAKEFFAKFFETKDLKEYLFDKPDFTDIE